MRFRDRREAGERLATHLEKYRGHPDALVLAIPRGGAEIGSVIAGRLGLSLDVLLIKKLGHPNNPEFAIGSVSLGTSHLNKDAVEDPEIPSEYVPLQVEIIRAELKRKYQLYRGCDVPLSLARKVVIVVDDGAATGSTLFAGIELLRKEFAKAVVVAVPVGPRHVIEALQQAADEVVCLKTPEEFSAVGEYYLRFDPVPDHEVVRLLRASASALVERG